jgi:hypothetical protein
MRISALAADDPQDGRPEADRTGMQDRFSEDIPETER